MAGEMSAGKHLVRQFLELTESLFLQATVERTHKALDRCIKWYLTLLKANLYLPWKPMKVTLQQNSVEYQRTQAFLISRHAALLCFTDVAFFTN